MALNGRAASQKVISPCKHTTRPVELGQSENGQRKGRQKYLLKTHTINRPVSFADPKALSFDSFPSNLNKSEPLQQLALSLWRLQIKR